MHPSLPCNLWAHVQLAVLHLCTGSLQKLCFINQIISEKAIFNFTGYKWCASVLYTLHWMLNAGTKRYSWYRGEIFHYDDIRSNLQMNSRFLASLFFPFLCGTWNPEKQLWLTLNWGHWSVVTVSALPLSSYSGAAEGTPTHTAEQLQVDIPYSLQLEVARSKREVSRAAADAQQSFQANATPRLHICHRL